MSYRKRVVWSSSEIEDCVVEYTDLYSALDVLLRERREEGETPVAVKIELPDNVDEDPVDSASEPEQDLEEMQSGDELDGSRGSESDAEVDEGEQVIQSEIQDDNGLQVEYFADF
ncbi:hypothetical protein M378DRAFT_28520 [Amanita muscaria Koide BX008]|uniref:Uncharacterized protein n=1 Tax=Amanita muscaria (strain Koide BX008) TaxID=946122 RepID=A0A0C2SP04_AMAMK|nr:hypothetical protein M378DRAFT_28520 [Amanita muscaria Koide BX008]